MNPQEQAQVVADDAARARCLHQWKTVNDPPCDPSEDGWTGCHLCVGHSIPGDAAAIRAAVDLVLPEERSLCDRSWRRMRMRAEFLAIAAALEAPANG